MDGLLWWGINEFENFFFVPFYCRRWSGVTHRWMENFWRKGLAPETGVSLIPVVRVTKKKVSKIPSWGSIVYGTVAMSNEEILQLNEEKGSNYK